MILDIPFNNAVTLKNNYRLREIYYQLLPEFSDENLPIGTERNVIDINGQTYLRLKFLDLKDWTIYNLKYN